MKPYLVSLAVGLLVGVIYALFNVRSPAPPVIALVGLLGILVGEQLPPLVKKMVQRDAASEVSWLTHQVKPHMFGALPTCVQVQARGPQDASFQRSSDAPSGATSSVSTAPAASASSPSTATAAAPHPSETRHV